SVAHQPVDPCLHVFVLHVGELDGPPPRQDVRLEDRPVPCPRRFRPGRRVSPCFGDTPNRGAAPRRVAVHPRINGRGDLIEPSLSVDFPLEVSGVLPLRRVPVAGSPTPVRTFLDRRHYSPPRS